MHAEYLVNLIVTVSQLPFGIHSFCAALPSRGACKQRVKWRSSCTCTLCTWFSSDSHSARITAASPVAVDTAASPVAVETAASPVAVETAASPVAVETAASPVAVETATSPVAVETAASPVAVETAASPVAVEMAASPVAVEMAASPVAVETARQYGWLMMLGIHARTMLHPQSFPSNTSFFLIPDE